MTIKCVDDKEALFTKICSTFGFLPTNTLRTWWEKHLAEDLERENKK